MNASTLEPSLYCTAKEACVHNNVALAQLLGLCPLLAASTTLVAALGLGIATLLVITMSALMVSLLRRWIPDLTRLPMMILLIAAMTTLVLLLMQAWAFDLYQRIALYVQIIVTNCAILARVESRARHQPVGPSLADAFGAGFGLLFVLLLIGGVRELLGYGTLGRDLDLLLGPTFADWTLRSPWEFPLLVLPAGAFLLLGVLVALYQGLGLSSPAGATPLPGAAHAGDSP